MGTNINLLQLESLTQASGLAEVHVVYDNKDYRMTLATLISLVSKATLGLDKVNNTSDAEKPVSNATAQALAEKADRSAVPTKDEFDALVNSLQGYVTTEQLNSAILQLTEALQNYATKEEVNAAVGAALDPVNQALLAITQSIGSHNTQIGDLTGRVAALENNPTTGGITQEALDSAIASSTQGITATITAVSENFQLAVDQLSARMRLIENTVAGFNTALQNHTHETTAITGLEEYVNNLIELSGGAIQINVTEW